MDFRDAYYAVKKEFREDIRLLKRDHPYFWAAFTLYE
jgi:hypothetical protein